MNADLIDELTGDSVRIGQPVTDNRGEPATLTGWCEPTRLIQTGVVWVMRPGSGREQQHRPSTFNLKFIPQ